MRSWLLVLLLVPLGFADAETPAERTAISDAIVKLSESATQLASTAKASDDRGVRKKFAPKAVELGDDLAALARRAKKDVAMSTIATELAAVDKDAAALIELADEADDKAERKALRASATSLEASVAAVKQSATVAATSKAPAAVAAKLPTITAPGFKALAAAVADANTDAQKLSVMRAAMAANAFPVAHVAFLMDQLNTEAPKVDCATYAWPNLVDPQNGFQLFAKLELEGSKAELHRRVGR